jgi:hypothetical protein
MQAEYSAAQGRGVFKWVDLILTDHKFEAGGTAFPFDLHTGFAGIPTMQSLSF